MKIWMNDLFYIYENSGERVVALRGLDLSVELGECLVIRGPNGSGKSTLVKLLTGYQVPSAGEIFIGDFNIAEIDPIRLRREYVSSIDQSGNLIKELNVIENLILAYSLRGVSNSESQERATQTLKDYQISDLSSQMPEELSAGERQYVSLLAAVATDPKVLIADEPSEELDGDAAATVYTLLKSLCSNTIVILVTHDDRAEAYATRIVRIREGRISEKWSPGESEESVVDKFGWTRVREISPTIPTKLNAATSSELLAVKSLKLAYGKREIFSELSFAARPGELIVLDSADASNSGKSSLLRILAGVQDPSSGEVIIAGENIRDLDRSSRAEFRSKNIGYLPQRGSVIERITLREHLAPFEVDLGRLTTQRLESPLGTFSGGERARIELLKMIAEARPILLLDEPTSQLDESRTLEVIGALYAYLAAGGVAIVSSRNEHLLRAADLIVRLQTNH